MKLRVYTLGALLLSLLGCAHQQTRLQSEEEVLTEKVGEIKVIGDVTTVTNADSVVATGVGLVVGLDGTGGGAPPGGYKTMLEDYLQKRGVPNIKELLASNTTALVLVSTVIPAGARKGDPLDLDIVVPPGSRTTSLRGGKLMVSDLYNYDLTKNLSKNYNGPDRLVRGHRIATGEGLVLIGFGGGEESAREKVGRIWAGGVSKIDRPFSLVLNSGQQYARVAQACADRINETFQAGMMNTQSDLAIAQTKSVVYLSVPPQYKLNLPRYLRVVRLVPLRARSEASRISYRRKLEEQLLDPATTVSASLRLEALGQDSIPTLKRGLKNDQPLVRFCSAEALAYLGSPSAGDVLSKTVEDQPALRAFALTAMASLDEAVCHVELRRLLDNKAPEARYGAFRALRALDEHDAAVQGDHMNESFWLHHTAPGSSPLIHVSTQRRPEIVLFGEPAYFLPPFPIAAGEYTLTGREGDEHCTIGRASAVNGNSKRQCSLKLEDVIRCLSEMGASYPDIVEVLKKADQLQCLTCRVAVDALPQATSVFDLAEAASPDSELAKEHPEILKAQAELGGTPTLFQKGGRARTPHEREMDEEASLNDRKKAEDEAPPQPATGKAPTRSD